MGVRDGTGYGSPAAVAAVSTAIGRLGLQRSAEIGHSRTWTWGWDAEAERRQGYRVRSPDDHVRVVWRPSDSASWAGDEVTTHLDLIAAALRERGWDVTLVTHDDVSMPGQWVTAPVLEVRR